MPSCSEMVKKAAEAVKTVIDLKEKLPENNTENKTKESKKTKLSETVGNAAVSLVNPRLQIFKHRVLLALCIGILTTTGVVLMTMATINSCSETCAMTTLTDTKGKTCSPVNLEQLTFPKENFGSAPRWRDLEGKVWTAPHPAEQRYQDEYPGRIVSINGSFGDASHELAFRCPLKEFGLKRFEGDDDSSVDYAEMSKFIEDMPSRTIDWGDWVNWEGQQGRIFEKELQASGSSYKIRAVVTKWTDLDSESCPANHMDPLSGDAHAKASFYEFGETMTPSESGVAIRLSCCMQKKDQHACINTEVRGKASNCGTASMGKALEPMFLVEDEDLWPKVQKDFFLKHGIQCCEKVCPSFVAALGSAMGYASYIEIMFTFPILALYMYFTMPKEGWGKIFERIQGIAYDQTNEAAEKDLEDGQGDAERMARARDLDAEAADRVATPAQQRPFQIDGPSVDHAATPPTDVAQFLAIVHECKATVQALQSQMAVYQKENEEMEGNVEHEGDSNLLRQTASCDDILLCSLRRATSTVRFEGAIESEGECSTSTGSVDDSIEGAIESDEGQISDDTELLLLHRSTETVHINGSVESEHVNIFIPSTGSDDINSPRTGSGDVHRNACYAQVFDISSPGTGSGNGKEKA